ncbi:extracellular solute-binding protein [Paenibacillus tarimensis]
MIIMLVALIFPRTGDVALSAEEKTDAAASHSADFDLPDVPEGRYTYADYANAHAGAAQPEREIVIDADTYTSADGMEMKKFDNFEGVQGVSVWTDEQGRIEWEVDVPETGMYNMSMLYYPIEGKSSDIQRSILIDGQLPFAEAAYLQFYRIWTNLSDEIKRDNRGNDLRPQQTEKPMWQEQIFKDVEGYYEEPFKFYFTAGKHTITFISQREPVVIRHIRIYKENPLLPYEELLKRYEAEGLTVTAGHMIEVQGEDAVSKSSPTLYPISDRSSPNVEPYSPSLIRVNTIGGFNWRVPGQWIAWEVEAPETGLYSIGLKVKQDFTRGVDSVRKLTINGEVPFKEAEELRFNYRSGFNMELLGGEDPYLFYLNEGKNVVKLEVTLGRLSPLIREVETSLLNLNAMYRKVLMITGTAPDEFRDYQLEKKIPDMIGVFTEESARLTAVAKQLESMRGERSDREAVLLTMSDQLLDMVRRPETIPRRLTAFKINAGGLGTWILQAREMPLEIDSIVVASPGKKLSKGSAGWFSKMRHEVTRFAYSFFIDYNEIGNVADEGAKRSITVWIGSGRDQAQTMKAMIDDTFTPESGISVNLKLVQMQYLLPATLAGQGPDVAMQIGNDIPVNYALRGAAADLSQFADFNEVAERFRASAMVPYHFDGGYYALPETQTFNMLFYRKDILKELGLEIPQTWQDVYTLLAVLSKNHLEFGLPLALQPQYPGENIPPNSVYAALLFQHGGQFYRNDDKQSDLDSETAVRIFKEWTELYTDYKLPREFDFANRIRTGEMPIGLSDYTTYNQLTVFAPEIRGLWGFVPVPGVVKEDGTIDRSVPSGGSSVLMLEKAQDKEAAWEFMKWWTSADTQTKFGREMEGLMGAAARYPTANIEALGQLPWPIADYKNLSAQFEEVKGIPEVPGGYFTGRHLINAFYKTVVGRTEPREALTDYVQYIQEEMTFKRIEFGLPTE